MIIFYMILRKTNIMNAKSTHEMIPQDCVAEHKSKLHLIFQGQFSGSRCKYATQQTATNNPVNLIGKNKGTSKYHNVTNVLMTNHKKQPKQLPNLQQGCLVQLSHSFLSYHLSSLQVYCT